MEKGQPEAIFQAIAQNRETSVPISQQVAQLEARCDELTNRAEELSMQKAALEEELKAHRDFVAGLVENARRLPA